MAAGLPDAIAYLQQCNEQGRSLYDHLTDVVLQLLEQRPARAYETFEALSFEMKKRPADSAGSQRDPQASSAHGAAATLLPASQDLLRAPTDGAAAAASANEGDMPDLVDQLAAFEWGGVAIAPAEESYKLQLSLRRLLEREPLQNIRLWGKILARGADYYVCESLYKEGALLQDEQKGDRPDSPHDSDIDDAEAAARAKKAEEEAAKAASETPVEKSVGANKFTYWVCHNSGEQWVKLPNVTPAQIKAARGVRKMLTGRLDAPVVAWPAFPGNEANLLRAQIARIAAATTVSPRGYYSLEEEAEDEDEENAPGVIMDNEEYTGLPPDALSDLSNWVHHAPALRMQGRCTPWVAPRQNAEGDGEEDEEHEDEEERETPEVPPNPEELEVTPKLLTAVTDDEPVCGKPAWTTRRGSLLSRNAPVLAFSNRWPGAVAVAYSSGTKFATMYVGYGLKYEDKPFIPTMPKLPEPDAGMASVVEQADPTLDEEREVERKKEEEERKKKEEEEAAAAAVRAEEEAAEADTQGVSGTDTENPPTTTEEEGEEGGEDEGEEEQ